MSEYICPICLKDIEKFTKYCKNCGRDIIPIATPKKDK